MTISDEMVERAFCAWHESVAENHLIGIKTHLRAALTAALQGSVVVPAEPTPAMIEAADIQDDEYYITNPAAFVTEIWQKMVAASQVTRQDGGTP